MEQPVKSLCIHEAIASCQSFHVWQPWSLYSGGLHLAPALQIMRKFLLLVIPTWIHRRKTMLMNNSSPSHDGYTKQATDNPAYCMSLSPQHPYTALLIICIQEKQKTKNSASCFCLTWNNYALHNALELCKQKRNTK